ncbi:PfkB family carbohydrate kinase [Streptomyces dysideae]|uniref:Carbohydrate kinase PfkB domain-containing protein n=1 Tax=Streptomyces dysideae TaxID=909626 RepID=A0A117RZU4_9ACTN|nr:PfkB family carbohydrate kinase [Streptomyces dysideae]KUO17809.1 hypothetical protein AQJ91_29370 [Streptomyces dysideae]
MYFKDPGADGTRTYSYRRDSAATTLGLELTGLPQLPGPAVSFDVNHRPALWRNRSADPAVVLLELDRHAEIVFVGRDEAEELWGTAKADEVRDLLAPDSVIVVKDADHGATSYTRDGEEVFVPAPASRVVERVGAGDAFAAGYLAVLLEGRETVAALRLGHLLAAATLHSCGDVPAVLAPSGLDRHLALDDRAWSALRLY